MSEVSDLQQGQETPLSDGSGGGGSSSSEAPSSRGLTHESFQILCSDLGSLMRIPDEEFSDLSIVVDGRKVPVHRCILAARCSGLRKVFAEMEPNNGSNNKPEVELGSIVTDGKLGFEAFMAVMGYVYGGKMDPWPATVACFQPSCAHLTCRPAIDYVLEILRASILFSLPELKTLAQVCTSSCSISNCSNGQTLGVGIRTDAKLLFLQEHLIDFLGKFQVDDVLHVHRSASSTECAQLQSACLSALAASSLDNLTLEREFSGEALEQVRRLRKELGLEFSHLTPAQEKQCKRIHRQCFFVLVKRPCI